jgi:hypothetical protein
LLLRKQRQGGSQLETSEQRWAVIEILPQSMAGHGGNACHPSYVGKPKRQIIVQASLSIKQISVSKITKAKRVGGVFQEV